MAEELTVEERVEQLVEKVLGETPAAVVGSLVHENLFY